MLIYPEPKKSEITGEVKFSEQPALCFSAQPPLDGKKFDLILGAFERGNDVAISAFYAEPDANANPEAFTLEIRKTVSGISAEIYCLSDAALVHALFLLKKTLAGNALFLGRITDYPSFEIRGYIEGFYGRPWRHSQRLEMLELMAGKGENRCYYAPKDDPYHRRLWRELYPSDELERLTELVNKANGLCVSLAYCIAPGLSIRYTDKNDLAALYAKIGQLYSIGIRSFGLLLDDIPEGFTCKEDEQTYPDFASAHIDLVNACYTYIKSLEKDCTLTVCPTVYWGKGDDEYDIKLGGGIPEDVFLFFTGRDICSREITCAEAEYIKKCTGHAPLYWDNFPVNDAEMFKEMHLAPLNGREAGLYRCCPGLISNCMEYFECGKFPLFTAADYLWAPESYDPERSFEAALGELLPENEIPAFVLLADNLRTSCLRDENSRIMGRYLSKATALISSGEAEKAVPVVEEFEKKINNAKICIEKGQTLLYKELGEWTDKFSLMAEILSDSLGMLKNGAYRDEGAKAALGEKMASYNNCATVLTAFCFREYIETVLGMPDGGQEK